MDATFWGALVRLVIALPLTLLLVYVVLRYGLPRRFAAVGGQRRMRLVEQLPLGPKAWLALVRVGGRYYLLAHQDGAVVLVETFDDLPDPLPADALQGAGGLEGGLERLVTKAAARFKAVRSRRRPPGGGAG